MCQAEVTRSHVSPGFGLTRSRVNTAFSQVLRDFASNVMRSAGTPSESQSFRALIASAGPSPSKPSDPPVKTSRADGYRRVNSTPAVIRAPSGLKYICPRASDFSVSKAPPRTIIPAGGGISPGGRGNRSSKGPNRRAPSGVSKPAASAIIAPAMRASPARAKRVKPSRIPKTPTTMARDTGSATNQKILEAMKNMQLPDRRLGLFYGSEILALLARAIGSRVRFLRGRDGGNPGQAHMENDV